MIDLRDESFDAEGAPPEYAPPFAFPIELKERLRPGADQTARAYPLTPAWTLPLDHDGNPDDSKLVLVSDCVIQNLWGAPAKARGWALGQGFGSGGNLVYPLLWIHWREPRLGQLVAALANADSVATVTLDGVSVQAGNYLNLSAAASDQCLLVPMGPTDDTEYLIAGVILRSTSLIVDSGYDASRGAFTKTAQTFYLPLPVGSSTASDVVSCTPTASGLLRDDTVTAVSLASSSSIVRGEGVAITAMVTNTYGTAPLSGVVQFLSDTQSLGYANLGTGGTATLTLATGLPAIDVGTHTITAQYQGDANYNPSTSSGTSLTVAKADTTTALVVSTTTSTYGDSVTLTATVTATSPGGGVPDGTVQFKAGSTVLAELALNGSGVAGLVTSRIPAGVQSLTAVYVPSTALGGPHYNASTSSAASLTVSKASLLGTVQSTSRTYGDPNPAFTLIWSGFQNGEGIEVLGGEPAWSCAAVRTSDVGPYAVTAATGFLAADNYSFAFVAGTLTVTAAPLVAIADAQSMPRGGPLPALTGTLTGVKNGDDLQLACSTDADIHSAPGDYVITPAIGGDTARLGNYALSQQQASLRVFKP